MLSKETDTEGPFIYGLLNGFYHKLEGKSQENASTKLVWKGDPRLKGLSPKKPQSAPKPLPGIQKPARTPTIPAYHRERNGLSTRASQSVQREVRYLN